MAGQINGTSGYEEAASQGLMAGINAVLVTGEDPFILDRSEAYIGVLIDDLITKGTEEPYRLFTSRAEYRLLLRQDNADIRLSRYGHGYGLVDDAFMRRMEEKTSKIRTCIETVRKIKPNPETINPVLMDKKSAVIETRQDLYRILSRPHIGLEDLSSVPEVAHLLDSLGDLRKEVIEQIEIEIKYEGYLQRQADQVDRFKRLEEKTIPEDMDYLSIGSLSKEAREKLNRIRPMSLGQAGRISGVSPSDLSVLMLMIMKKDKGNVPRGTY